MSYKTILVHLNESDRNAETLRVACGLARKFGAHLVAIYSAERRLFAPAMDAGAAAVTALQVEVEVQMRERATSILKEAERESGLAIEWRAATGSAINNVILHARHADLTVMTQEDPTEKSGMNSSVPASVVVAAGRPVLVVPYAGDFRSCGESVLIAWSGTRESARALADALPMLKLSKEVNVVSFNPRGDSGWGEIPGADIGLWLTRHGVKVNVRQQKSAEVDVGNQILSLAADLGANMIVMGAYGHSRTFQFVLGGVTRTLLDTMTVPVLMSH
jgi:nucleotide-binding universal stress UspA family protein